MAVAKSRKSKLETLYDENRHDPWIRRWYENPQIKPLIIGKLTGTDISRIKAPASDDPPTLFEAIQLYIAYKTPDSPDRKQSYQWNPDTTAPREQSTLNSFCDHVGPAISLQRITGDHLRSFIERDTISSDHTASNYARRLNTFFNYCKSQGWITYKPNYAATRPQADIPVFIYNDELLQICRYKLSKVNKEIEIGYTQPDDSQMYMPLGWILIRMTGMRPIELRKLYLDAVDLPGRQIKIGARTKGRTNRTKTAVQRNIPMNDVVYRICKLLCDPELRAIDRRMRDSDHIFGRPGKQSQRKLSSEFTEARRHILPDRNQVTLYTLRDTQAVELLAKPSDIQNPLFEMKRVRDLMGHKSITTTEKYWKAVPHRVQHQRLCNSTIFCKIVGEFHQSYLEIT